MAIRGVSAFLAKRFKKNFALLSVTGVVTVGLVACAKDEPADEPVFNNSHESVGDSSGAIIEESSNDLWDTLNTPQGKKVVDYYDTGEIQEGDWCTPEVNNVGGERTFLDIETGEVFEGSIDREDIEAYCAVALRMNKDEGLAYMAVQAKKADSNKNFGYQIASLDYIRDRVERTYPSVDIELVMDVVDRTDYLEREEGDKVGPMEARRFNEARKNYLSGLHPSQLSYEDSPYDDRASGILLLSPEEYQEILDEAGVNYQDFAFYVLLSLVKGNSKVSRHDAGDRIFSNDEATESEMREALKDYGFDDPDIEQAIERTKNELSKPQVAKSTFNELIPEDLKGKK